MRCAYPPSRNADQRLGGGGVIRFPASSLAGLSIVPASDGLSATGRGFSTVGWGEERTPTSPAANRWGSFVTPTYGLPKRLCWGP